MPPAYEVLLLNTAIPQIQAAQSGDTYLVPRDIAFSAALTLTAGTANGVPYLNGSKVLTTGSALTFDGTNLGNTRSVATAFSGTNAATWANGIVLTNTATPAAGVASLILFQGISNVNSAFGVTQNASGFGDFVWAGYSGSFSEQMRLTSTGLGIGTSSPTEKLTVAGNIKLGTSGTTWIYGPATTGRSIYSNSDSTAYLIAYGSSYGGTNDAGLSFVAGTTNSMTFNSSGNLGLGVTPSAWESARKAIQLSGTASYFAANSVAVIAANNFFDGQNKYIGTDYATQYAQSAGQHIWLTAPSGTADGTAATSLTSVQNGNSYTIKVAGTTDFTLIGAANNNVGTTFTKSGGTGAGTGTVSQNISFTQAMTLDASGNLLVGTTSAITIDGTAVNHAFQGSTNGFAVGIQNTNNSTPFGLAIKYTAAAPNGTGSQFLYCSDNLGVNRAEIRSNGGLANYQANDVNLSDQRVKKDIVAAPSYWDKIKGIEIVHFKYKDQTHDDNNVGVIAQQVEQVAPEFVDQNGWGDTPEDGVPLKSIYTSDMHHAAIKALQEAMARIEKLEAEVAALKGA